VIISGVYLCKHADILQPSPFHNGQSGYLVVFKILKVNFYNITVSLESGYPDMLCSV